MTIIGAAVLASASPHNAIDLGFRDGLGGSCSGEEAENGMKDRRLGSKREDGIRLICWRTANMRKCREM